ncbi:MAG: hypothetical protein QOC97_1189, partial [Chloroflexota bacterium]|nr:hypothetical protein [Chloroflexota bacterium]
MANEGSASMLGDHLVFPILLS